MPLSSPSPLNLCKLLFDRSDNLVDMGASIRCRFLDEIITIGHHGEDLTVPATKSDIPSLLVQASNACAQAITDAGLIRARTALNNVADFIQDNRTFPASLQRPLKAALYARWKTLNHADSAWLAESVAIERVLRKENCIRVARDHDINHQEFIDLLMKVAAHGVAGQRVYQGENCITVAENHGIDDDDAFKVLERFAVMGKAGERVQRGENCETVAVEQGIFLADTAMDALEMMAVNGPAGKRVRAGEDVRVVAAAHGIERGSSAMRKLKAMAPSDVTLAKRPRRD